MQNPDELLKIYSTSDANEAEIIKGALHGEGIKCEISGESQAGLTGLNSLEIQLLVKAEDFERAREFIEQHQREG
jgi:hypothetical protein